MPIPIKLHAARGGTATRVAIRVGHEVLQLAAAVVAYDVVRPDDGGLAKVKLESLKQGKLERKAHREKILRFIQILNKAGDDSLGDFDENLFRQVVESMTVHALDDIVVRFVSGVDIKVNII